MNFSKKIQFIPNLNTKIFKIENFLDIDLYNGIYNNFPTISEDQIKLTADYGGKAVLKSNTSEINKNIFLKKLHTIILSEEFFKFFTNFFILKLALFKITLKEC